MRHLVAPLVVFVSLLASIADARADDAQPVHLAPNSVYAEGYGAGLADSLNYERIVGDRLALRAGMGLAGAGFSYRPPQNGGANGPFFALPLTVSYVGVRAHEHALEVGGGVTITDQFVALSRVLSVYANKGGAGAFGVAFIGYRLHPEGRAGVQIRAGVMALVGNGFALSGSDPPSYDDAARFGVVPWGYLSFGASF